MIEDLIVGTVAVVLIVYLFWALQGPKNFKENSMAAIGWLQLAAFVAALVILTKPLGIYLVHVLDRYGRTFLDPVFNLSRESPIP